MSVKTAGIIIIGDEILKGHVVDKNSNFLCNRFYSLSIKVVKISVIQDDVNIIADEVSNFSKKFDFVITTGGVGPTHDDVTYEGIGKAFGEVLCPNQLLIDYFKYYILQPAMKNNHNALLKMITVPKRAEIIFVTASEILKDIIDKDRFPIVKLFNVFVFPGVPEFLEQLFIGIENDYFKNVSDLFYIRILYLNVSENFITSSLNKISERFKPTVSFGSYPDFHSDVEYKTKIAIESTVMEDCLMAESSFLMEMPPYWVIYPDNTCSLSMDKMHYLMASKNSLVPLLKQSIEIIEECFDKYDLPNVFISFNGGKDCTVMMYLIYYVYWSKEFNKLGQMKALHYKHPLSFPEEDKFVEESSIRYDLDLITTKIPLKESLQALLKEDPQRNVSFLGVRNSDPKGIRMKSFQMTDDDWPQIMRVSPLLEWNYKDVWNFLRSMNIPYCSLYNEGYTSIGIQTDTVKNHALKYTENDNIFYRPAYLLDECSKEREGRTS